MEKTRSYVALFIVAPEKESTIDEVKNVLNSVITENAGKIQKENMIGKKTLAYPIQKKTQGFYYEVLFDANPESVVEMSRQFRINTSLLRTLIDKNT
ncbi:MAG: 30S ribosomal protein S6 [Candidatus Omnitrophota bacterium]